MREHERFESVVRERAVLVRVITSDRLFIEEPLAELRGLATTAGTVTVGELLQRRSAPDCTTYLGQGKVAELKGLVASAKADVVIFDNDLNPAQTRNLETELQVKVIDRTELILDIFASNARTHEARLAVELAQLEYSLPRLKRKWTHLSRIKAGIGMRGPGEKQLEVDRRIVRTKIDRLKAELRHVRRVRATQRRASPFDARTGIISRYCPKESTTLAACPS